MTFFTQCLVMSLLALIAGILLVSIDDMARKNYNECRQTKTEWYIMHSPIVCLYTESTLKY